MSSNYCKSPYISSTTVAIRTNFRSQDLAMYVTRCTFRYLTWRTFLVAKMNFTVTKCHQHSAVSQLVRKSLLSI